MARRNDQGATDVILDEFSTADLNRWQRFSELDQEYQIKLYYHLEALRAMHYDQLVASLEKYRGTSSSASNWWRMVDLRYSDNPLSPKGSVLVGGRFNIGNVLAKTRRLEPFPVLYIAENEETARSEKFGNPAPGSGLLNHEFALRTETSYSAVRLEFSLENMFDLTNAAKLVGFTSIISKFKLSRELIQLATKLKIKPPYLVSKASHLRKLLLENKWRYYPAQYDIPSNSQLFGRMLKDAGYEAVIFPSTQNPKHNNIAIFVQNLEKSDSFVKLQDEAGGIIQHTRIDASNWRRLC